jgi:hypothetical protein
MNDNKPTLVKKSQGLHSKLRETRESGQGIVTYHFEEVKTFNDHKGDPTNKAVVTEEVGRKWTIQQPINNEVFFNHKGKHVQLDEVAELLKDIASDIGAKYFTI